MWSRLVLSDQSGSTISGLFNLPVVMLNSASGGVLTHNTECFNVTSIHILSDGNCLTSWDLCSSRIGTCTSNWLWIARSEVSTIGCIGIAEHGGAWSVFTKSNVFWRCCIRFWCIVITSWIIVIFERWSTVDTSTQSNGTIDLLSDSDLFGVSVLVMCSITVVTFVANINIWISTYLGLADPKGPWSRSFYGEKGIKWSHQGIHASCLKQDTIQDWASRKRGDCCSLRVRKNFRIDVDSCWGLCSIVDVFFGSNRVSSQGLAIWFLSHRPIVKGDNWVVRIFAFNTDYVNISSINIFLNSDFTSNCIDCKITYGVSVDTTSLFKGTIVDVSAQGSMRVGEEINTSSGSNV